MTPASTAKRRPATTVSAYAYADRCRRVDELLKACAERDTVIAAQRAQIRDLRIAVLRANKRAERCASPASPSSASNPNRGAPHER